MLLYSQLQSLLSLRSNRKSNIKRFVAVALTANALGLSPVNGDDSAPAEAAVKKAETVSEADGTKFESDAIPGYLQKLKLTDKQQDQIKEVIHDYNGSIAKVWKQFSERYLQTIVVESSLLAAIEDNFTEQQRQRIRDLRRKTAQHEKSLAASSSSPDQPNTKPADPATAKPADPVEDAIAGVGVSLSAEQETMVEKVEEKYRYQLRSLNREIQGFHARLLSLEADKLVAIEKLLTKDQLTELRTNRQSKPEVLKTSAHRSQHSKSE